jgi:hypothetical protein
MVDVMRRTVALGAAGAVLGAAAAGGVAFAADSTSWTAGTPRASATTTAATTGPSTPDAKRRHRRALAGRALHGSFTVQRKTGTAVVDVQRGQVTTSTPTSVTIRSTDGFAATYTLGPSTHIRKDRKPAAAAVLTPGAEVALVADDGGGHPAARVIRVAG